MKSIKKQICIVILVISMVAPVMGLGNREGGVDVPEAEQALSVSKIVLFSTGLGYFQRTGVVENNESIDIRFKNKDVNDLLKSMILQDLDGGSITSVNYSSREPLNVTLRSMSIDLSGNPGIIGILNQLRGEEVVFDLADGEGTLRGAIVGIEGSRVNLYGRRGIVGVETYQIEAIRFVDPFLDTEFRKALKLITDSKNTDEKRVTIGFAGEGSRRVLVGYLLETPVWKTTYRLVLGEDDEHMLQGWAIVENTTDEDWTDIGLSLVSGRPISFIMDLYSPIYNRRPTVQIQTSTALAPQSYEAAPKISARSAPSMAPEAFDMPSAMAEGSGGFDDFGDFDVELDISQGVRSAATTERAGEFFRYVIQEPVSLPRKESAMVPIVNEAIEGQRISIFNSRHGLSHPYNGLRFTNTTDIDLMGGPLTVFEAGTYAGDSQIGAVYTGDERILSYSLDLATEVRHVSKTLPVRMVEIAIEKGILVVDYIHRMETNYEIASRGLREKTVLVEHPIVYGWKLVEPDEPSELTPNYYRFDVGMPASPEGSQDELTVAVEQYEERRTDLLGAGDSFIQSYIDLDGVPGAVKAPLRGILERRTRLNETIAKRRERETRRSAIHREQDRIRRNMENLDKDDDLYKQYVETLTNQETELEEISRAISDLLNEEQRQRRELEEYVRSLQT